MVPRGILLWLLIFLGGVAIAATAAINHTAAKAIAIGVGGFLSGIAFLKMLSSRR